MLRITRLQMHRFSAECLEEFYLRLMHHVRIVYASRYNLCPDRELRALVAELHARAVDCGFMTERQIVRFADWAIYFGETFGRPVPGAWWADVIADRTVDEDSRLDILESRSLREL